MVDRDGQPYCDDRELLCMPPLGEAGDSHGQYAEVPDDLRAVPQAPVVDSKHFYPSVDGELLDLPSESEAVDACE